MRVGFRIVGAAGLLMLALAAGPVRADEAPANALTLVPGGVVEGDSPANDGGTSLLWGLARQLAETRFTVGSRPAADGVAPGFDDTVASETGYDAFAQLEISGLVIAGRYGLRNDLYGFDGGESSYGLGAAYSLDAWTVGFDWTRGDFDEQFLDIETRDRNDVFSFTTSYDVRPGLRVGGMFEYTEDATPEDGSDSGFAVGIGTLLNF